MHWDAETGRLLWSANLGRQSATARPASLNSRLVFVTNANELFDVVKKGIVKIEVNQTYPLKDAARAHRDLESRKTTGSTVLLP